MNRSGRTGMGLLGAALAAAGLLTACGGGEEPGQPSGTPGQAAQAPTAEGAPEGADALQALRQRAQEAEREVARIRSEAASSLPVSDEELDGLLTRLDGEVAEVSRRLGGAAADAADAIGSALDGIDRRRREAADRLAALRAEEQAKRQELLTRLQELTETSGETPPDLTLGFDGEAYPGYRSSAVERVQRELQAAGLYQGAVDGELDDETKVAIARFQQIHGLHVTGIPSPRTRERYAEGDTE